MDKDEILKRSREEGIDEREQKIYLDALRFSGVVVCIICIVFIIISIIKGNSIYPYCIMAMAYCATDNLYRYIKLHRKYDLFFGLASAVAVVCWTILFVVEF